MDVFWVDAVDAGLFMFFRELFGEENQKLSLGHRWHLTFYGVRVSPIPLFTGFFTAGSIHPRWLSWISSINSSTFDHFHHRFKLIAPW